MKRAAVVPFLLVLVGAALIVAGVGLWAVEAGMVAAGVLLLALGLWWEIG